MKFIAAASCFTLFATCTFAVTTTVSFDNTYDASGGSLATVACSDGANGLLTKGFTTFGSLPSFPNVGGAPAVTGWNSTSCGTCWTLSFNGTTINVTAIDVATSGFNIAQKAMDTLTNGQAIARGRVTVNATQVAASACGL